VRVLKIRDEKEVGTRGRVEPVGKWKALDYDERTITLRVHLHGSAKSSFELTGVLDEKRRSGHESAPNVRDPGIARK
jgi:hypothetical protein